MTRKRSAASIREQGIAIFSRLVDVAVCAQQEAYFAGLFELQRTRADRIRGRALFLKYRTVFEAIAVLDARRMRAD